MKAPLRMKTLRLMAASASYKPKQSYRVRLNQKALSFTKATCTYNGRYLELTGSKF